MLKAKLIMIPVIMLIIVSIVVVNCGGGKKSVAPEYSDVSMSGNLHFTGSQRINHESISISFGNNNTNLDSIMAYDISGHKAIPGLMIASDINDSTPVLLGIIANPQDEIDVSLDAHSTALALVFMNPFICVSNAGDAALVIEMIICYHLDFHPITKL